MLVSDLVHAVDQISPFRYSENWDNVGLLIGDLAGRVERVLLTIDVGPAELDEAKALGCQAIVAYHPPIFKGLKTLLAGSIPYEIVRAGISVVSPHTALDVAAGGTNDTLAKDVLELASVAPLRVQPSGLGMGRKGRLLPPKSREEVFATIREKLLVDRLLVAGPRTGLVHSAAVCAGACGDLVQDAIGAKVDLYLTGELRHHDALLAARHGMTVVCALHSNSERLVLMHLKKRLEALLDGVECVASRVDCDPFVIC